MAIFGGQLPMTGAGGIALRRIFAALRIADWDFTRRQHDVLAYVRDHDDLQARRPIWWHVPSTATSSYYFNNDPGEYRLTPPEGDADIRQVPELARSRECERQLEEAIEFGSLVGFHQEYEDTWQTARTFLADPEAVEQDGRERFAALLPSAFSMDAEQFGPHLGKLVRECLICPRMNIADFSMAMALLQLQRMTGYRIEDDWVSNPGGHLHGYLEWMSESEETAKKGAAACTEAGVAAYRLGQEHLNAALRGASNASCTLDLILSNYYFSGAFYTLEVARKYGLAVELPTSPTVMEESVVCTKTAIHHGAGFMFWPFEEAADQIRDRAVRDRITNDEAARAWGANHVIPTFNRRFAEILAAQAMTLAEDADEIRRGLSRLASLMEECEADLAEETMFEITWVDTARLKAFHKLGDEDGGKRAAARLMGREIVAQGLHRAHSRPS
jgi:hypothetical protein